MDKPHTDDVAVQRHIMGNPWGASVPHWSAEGYNDPPTDSLTLQNALLAWKRKFGDQQLKLGIKDSVPFEQGAILGSGGLGVVYETKIDGIAVAWKRTYMRRLKDEHLNEVKILGQMTEERHIHIVKLVGSYIHRQRNSTLELAILTWPVARCDLSVLLHEIDLINEWKFRDDPLDENDWSTSPTEEEKAAYDNLLKLEQLEQERFRIFTWHLREKVRDAALQRLTRSIGCIAKAVEYLHNRGIRHKDLKPSQILLSSNGLWLTDFGWSRDISHLTCSETSGGDRITVRYHAPERAHMGKCGRPEDVFALGCTFLEMAYRIYGKDSKDYLNPTGNPMWSFQANLGSKDVWLAPFQLDKMSSRSLLGGLVGRMLAYEAWLRPSISEVIEVLLTPTSQSDSSFFAGCCAPDPSMQSPDSKAPDGPEIEQETQNDKSWSSQLHSPGLKLNEETSITDSNGSSPGSTPLNQNSDANEEADGKVMLQPSEDVLGSDANDDIHAPLYREPKLSSFTAQSDRSSVPAGNVFDSAGPISSTLPTPWRIRKAKTDSIADFSNKNVLLGFTPPGLPSSPSNGELHHSKEGIWSRAKVAPKASPRIISAQQERETARASHRKSHSVAGIYGNNGDDLIEDIEHDDASYQQETEQPDTGGIIDDDSNRSTISMQGHPISREARTRREYDPRISLIFASHQAALREIETESPTHNADTKTELKHESTTSRSAARYGYPPLTLNRVPTNPWAAFVQRRGLRDNRGPLSRPQPSRRQLERTLSDDMNGPLARTTTWARGQRDIVFRDVEGVMQRRLVYPTYAQTRRNTFPIQARKPIQEHMAVDQNQPAHGTE